MRITQEHLDKYNAELKDKAQGTIDTYYGYAKKLIGIELDQDQVTKLAKERSKNNYPSFLRHFCEKLELNFIVPKKERASKPTRIIHYFTKNEMDEILRNITDRKLNIIIRLMYENGLRVSEVLNIKWNNVEIQNDKIRGIGKGNKEFEINISYDMKVELKLHMEKFKEEDYLFRYENIKLQRKKVWDVLKKEIKAILPYKNEDAIYPHAFRHTCGTLLREAGWDLREIQTYLRHANLATVEKYTAVDKEKLRIKASEVFG